MKGKVLPKWIDIRSAVYLGPLSNINIITTKQGISTNLWKNGD